MKRISKGFTLIELLVVAIIGILATVVLTALSDARKKARDARRLQDIKQIQTALEVYYLENGRYPKPSFTGTTAPPGWVNSGNASSWEALETMMGVTLPRDPVNFTVITEGDWPGGANRRLNYAYITTSGGCPGSRQGYYLVYRLEKGDIPLSESPGVLLCDTSVYKAGAGAITVGMTPMM